MLYDSEVDVRGINAYRFVIDPANFAVVPENEGFCIPNASYCLPKGLLNVERCFGMLKTFDTCFKHIYSKPMCDLNLYISIS